MTVLILGTLDGVKGGVPIYIQNIVNNIKLEENINFVLASELTELDRCKYINTQFEKFDIRYSFFEIFNKVLKINRFINTYSISVIHAHTQRAAFIVSILSLFKKIQIIYTPHGLRHTQLFGFKRFFHKILEYFIIKRVNIITVLSDSELKSVKEICKNIDILKINTRIKSNVSLKQVEKENSIIMVGSCDSRKQPFLFIEIAKRFVDKNIYFYWIGSGDLYNDCIDDITINSLNHIFFTGEKSHHETLSILAKSKILLFTSLSEGIPISLLEAMSLNTAIISNNYNGYSDLLKHKVNSFVFNNSNVNDAVHYINEVISNNSIYAKISKNALDYFNSNYNDVEIFATEYAYLYNNIK